MEYRDSKAGFAVEVPDGWKIEQRSSSQKFPCMVFLNNGNLRIVIAVRPASPAEASAENRAAALILDLQSRGLLSTTLLPDRSAGGQDNMAAASYRLLEETQHIYSGYRDGLVYQFTHTGDIGGTVGTSLNRILDSFRYPSDEAASAFLKSAGPRSLLERQMQDIATTNTDKVLRRFHIPFDRRKNR